MEMLLFIAFVLVVLASGCIALILVLMVRSDLSAQRRWTDRRFHQIEERLVALEAAEEPPSPEPVEAPTETPAALPAQTPKEAELPQPDPPAQATIPRQPESQTPAAPEPPAPPPPAVPRPRPQPTLSWSDLESRLGSNWLNKLGVGVLVIGISLMLGYTFEQVGPAGKIAMGYALTALLLATGLWLETKDTYRLYGLGLVGGGWALGYFTTYALHFVAETRLIEQELTGISVLMVFTGIMIAHTLRYKSEVVTGVATAIAFATLAINPGTFLSEVAVLLLNVFLVAVVVRMRWLGAGLMGVAATFAVHLLGVTTVPPPSLFWGLLFPFLYWACYLLPALTLNPTRNPDRSLLQAVNIVNAGGLLLVLNQAPGDTTRTVLLAVVGSLYLTLALWARNNTCPQTFGIFAIVGSVLLVAAPALLMTGNSLIALWALQGLALLLTGILLREPIFSRLGMAAQALSAAALLTSGGMSGDISAFLGVLLHANLVLVPRWFGAPHAAIDRNVLRILTWPATLFLAVAIVEFIDDPIPAAFVGPAWVALAAGLWEWGITLKQIHPRQQSYALATIGCVLLSVFLVTGDFTTATNHGSALLAIGLLFAMSRRTRHASIEGPAFEQEIHAWRLFSYLGSFTVLVWTTAVVPSPWVAPAWAAMAAVALLLSIHYADAHLRSKAALLLAATFGRTLAINLAQGGSRFDGWERAFSVLAATAILSAAVAILTIARSRGTLKRTTSWVSPWFERHGADAVACGTSLLLVLLAWREASPRQLTLMLAGIGLVMMVGGLAIRLQSVRIAGMALLGFCVLRVFFYDLSGLDTFARIVSFVGLGLVLLLVSFLYTRFRKRLEAGGG